MSDEKVIYVTITKDVILDDVRYNRNQQFVYVRTEVLPVTHLDCGGNMRHYIGLNCDEVEIAFPEDVSVLYDVCIPFPNFGDHIRNRDMDKTKDYRTAVKKAIGYDLRNNHRMQVDRRYYDRLLLKVPKTETGEGYYGEVKENNISEETD
jgi:hypothetical protein